MVRTLQVVLSTVFLILCIQGKAQLTASSKTIDLGEIDPRQYGEVTIPVINQTNSNLRCFAVRNCQSVDVLISDNLKKNEEGQIQFHFKNNGKQKIREKMLVYTNYQEAPVAIKVKVNLKRYKDAKCPEFKASRVKTKKFAINFTAARKHQYRPLVLFDPAKSGRQFTSDPAVPYSHIVVLLDASTSMQSNGKLEEMKVLLKELVSSLRPEDRVSILKYNEEDEVVVQNMQAGQHDLLTSAIEDIVAWGYTNGFEGIKGSVELSESQSIPGISNHVVLCSDGAFNLGADARDIESFLRQRLHQFDFSFSVVSVGSEKKNAQDMKRLSKAGNGHYFSISGGEVNVKKINRLLIKQLL